MKAVSSALNFSWLSLHHRDELIDWLASVHESLNDPGLLVLDLMGGPKCMQAGSDTPRRIDDFEYVWEHVDFDPVSHRTLCRMHFRFDDGSAIDGAFEYDWRLWTLPELLDALEDVGFSKWAIYWEGLDPETGEGNGTFHKVGHAPPDNAWVAYVVAER